MADDWERSELVEASLARRLHIRKRRVRELFGELAANWESLTPEQRPAIPAEERARFTGAWREHREILGYTLLSELPYALRTALQDHPQLAGLDYSLLVVDEYQDLNACDLEVLRGLANRGCVMIAAGDDDQSIYSFRKAHPAGIRQFPEHYAGAADYSLSVTQRCGKSIVRWANYVMQGDPDRAVGRALNPVESAPEGDVGLFCYPGERSEARGVANLVRHLIRDEGVAAPEVLILLRADNNGTFSRPIKEELDALGIAYSDPDAVTAALEEDAARRSLSYLRLIENPEDSLAWATLLKLTDGVGDTFFDHIYEQARASRMTFARALLVARGADFEDGPAAPGRRAAAMIDEVSNWAGAILPPREPDGGWAAWITLTLAQTRANLPDALQTIFTAVDDKIDQTVGLSGYLNQVGPVARDLALAKADGVRIMRTAGSKGLTVEATILVGLENGLVPKEGCELAEERRLLYVGMTRAKKYLYGTWARRRRGPTARAGRGQVAQARQLSHFLDGGPVRTEQRN